MIKYNEINQLADSLMTGYFFEQQLDLLLVAAAMWNRIKIVRMLVDNCAVSLAGVQKALEAVQNKGNSQGVALLQAAWDIRTGGDVGTALQLAATYALNTTVGKMLESSVPFTERTIDDALIAAAQARAYDSFCLLYADKRASSVGKQYALQCACRNGLIQRRGDVFALLDDPLDIAC